MKIVAARQRRAIAAVERYLGATDQLELIGHSDLAIGENLGSFQRLLVVRNFRINQCRNKIELK